MCPEFVYLFKIFFENQFFALALKKKDWNPMQRVEIALEIQPRRWENKSEKNKNKMMKMKMMVKKE